MCVCLNCQYCKKSKAATQPLPYVDFMEICAYIRWEAASLISQKPRLSFGEKPRGPMQTSHGFTVIMLIRRTGTFPSLVLSLSFALHIYMLNTAVTALIDSPGHVSVCGPYF